MRIGGPLKDNIQGTRPKWNIICVITYLEYPLDLGIILSH